MFSCAAGGAPCQVTIDSDGTATSTGGTVMASLTATAQHLLNQNTANANRDTERSRVDAAISVAASAIIGINNESTESDLESAQEAIDNARDSIQSATALTQGDKNILLKQVGQQQTLLDSKKDARMAYLDEETRDKMEDENRTTRTQQRQAADMAIQTAFMKVVEINNDSTETDLQSAQEAIDHAKETIEMATHLPDDERTRRLALVQDYQDSFDDKEKMAMDAMNEKNKNMKMAKTKAAMNLYKALDGPDGGTNLTALDNTGHSTATIKFDDNEPDKLILTIARHAAMNPDAAEMAPALSPMADADSSGTLDGWSGMKYEHKDTNSGMKHEAVVYDNREEPEKISFAAWAADEGLTVSTGTLLTALGYKDYITIQSNGSTDASMGKTEYVMSPVFNHSGRKEHELENGLVGGTFNGVQGMFHCTTASGCYSRGNNSSEPTSLQGVWTFYPHPDGGMIETPVTDYLLYGWWVQKDKDEVPTAASAFFAAVGNHEYVWATGADADAITGSASYTGKAVGKFAIHDPFNADLNNSGHFTADAELKANFGSHRTDGNGVTGTIDNFRLNDMPEDPNWSVTLDNSDRWTANGGINGPTTTWSIDGIKAESSGSWEAFMYDTTKDDIELPTTTVGEFYSEVDSRYRMVGAFAAEIEE